MMVIQLPAVSCYKIVGIVRGSKMILTCHMLVMVTGPELVAVTGVTCIVTG